jgi:hypothetical protein
MRRDQRVALVLVAQPHAAIDVFVGGRGPASRRLGDDEAHAGHFAIATGRIDAHGDIGDWLVNNYYSLDIESEKGILAAPATTSQLAKVRTMQARATRVMESYTTALNAAYAGRGFAAGAAQGLGTGEPVSTGVIVAGRLIDADGTMRSGAAGGDSAEEAGVRALAVAAGLHRVTVRWHESSTEEPAGAPPGQEVDERPPRPAAPPVRGGAGLTERQASAIFAISRSLGWERERLLVWLHDEYGADELEGLSKVQASDVIGALQQLAVKQS